MSALTPSSPPRRRHCRPAHEVDATFVLAWIVVLALASIALYGPIVAPHDVYYRIALLDGQLPPFQPGSAFPLGSDDSGHDLLSWVLIGARSTLTIAVSAAILRMIIGGFFGTLAGWQGGRTEKLLSVVALAFSSAPATIFAALGVLAFNVYSGALGFAVALGLLGWGDAFHHARRHARAEGARQFIESARAQGMSETRVVMRHLVPSMAPTLLTVAALQVSAVLLLLGELGLLRLFVGGAEVIDFDQRTGAPSIVGPTNPDWSSMLAGARPIVSLHGASHTVLVPGLALLVAVLGTNLLGDVLARQARRLDIYRLASRRQALVLVMLVLALTTPAILWPSRLAPDLAAADRVSGYPGLEVAQALAAPKLSGRIAGEEGAAEAARIIAQRWGGELQAVVGEAPRAIEVTIRSPSASIGMGLDLTALSLESARVSGPLRDLDRELSTSLRAGSMRGNILVVAGSSRLATSSADLAWLASQTDAAGVLIVSDDIGAYAASSQHAVPTLRVGTRAFTSLTGTLPRGVDDSALPLQEITVSIAVTVERRAVRAINVIAKAPSSRPNPPLVLVIAAYDVAPYPHYLAVRPGWDVASAVGAATEVLELVRSVPLGADIIFVAVGADAFGSAGTTAFLRSLERADLRRVVAVIGVESLATGRPAVHVEQAARADPAAAGPAVRVAGRVADALGLRMRPSEMALSAVLRATSAIAPAFVLSDRHRFAPEPTQAAMRSGARALHVLLSYVARMPEELRP